MAGSYPYKFRELLLYDGRFDAYKLSAQGCDVLFAPYSAGAEMSPHSHDTDNHSVTTKGELILTMAGETKRYGVGQWYHVPANVEHAAQFNVETDEIEFWFKNES